MNRPVRMSQVCAEGRHVQCQGHDARGGCDCTDPAHTSPADEMHAAARLLRNPYNCLPNAPLIAELVDAVADEMAEADAVEGSASKAVHPRTVLGLGKPNRVWTAALALARTQHGIEAELARSVNATTGDPS
jgi:hypothetical protein